MTGSTAFTRGPGGVARDASGLHALILAAGYGRRLAAVHDGPKALLSFGGRSLMRRHVEALRGLGVGSITVVAGHGHERLQEALAAIDASVRVVVNPDFREGSVVSLSLGLDALVETRAGPGGVLLMDADVLYEPGVLGRLASTAYRDCFLVDRGFEPGDEPVKLCVQDGRIVDFAKRPEVAHDWHGESVGFFRFQASTAETLGARARDAVAGGGRMMEYEPILRDMIVSGAVEGFGFEDVTGSAWTEIDFPEDIDKARLLLDRVDRMPGENSSWT